MLLPVRDAVETVDAALASVLAQQDGDLELVVVDDGSRDGTGERLQAAAARDARVRVVSRPESRGDLIGALELGRRVARGDYLLRMDADDLAHPERLGLCRALLDADPRVGVASCLVRSFPELSVQRGRRRYDDWLNGLRRHEDMARERFVESPLAHPSALIRASALAEVGGYRDFAGPEDYDLWLRLFARGWRFEKVPALLHFWRERPDRFSRTDARYAPAGMALARAQALAVHLGPRPAAIVGAGTAGRRLARELLRAGARVQCFLDLDPRKVGRAPHGVPVLEHRAGLRARGEALVVTCVNAWGQRSRLRTLLEEDGLCEGPDFVLAG
ncbi:MAG: glycosyltransferase [Planctomycetota bacterium]